MSQDYPRGRRFVVTGSASGVGAASVRLFAERGAHVIGVDVNAEGNERVLADVESAGGSCEMHTVDVGDGSAVERFAADLLVRHERIDVLFNNAGAFQKVSWEDTTFEIWDEMIATNLSSAFYLTRSLLPGLKAAGQASVIHHSSVDGVYGNPWIPAYSSAKSGLTAMTHVMAYEFAPFGIRVNMLVSGGLETEMLVGYPRELIEPVVSASSLGRLGQPAEIAEVVLFLGGPQSSFVTGSTVTADGGRTSLTNGTYENSRPPAVQ